MAGFTCLFALATAGCSAGSDSTTDAAPEASPSASSSTSYAPYVSATEASGNDSSGSPSTYNLAFVISDGSECTPKWNDEYALANSTVKSRISQLREDGATVRAGRFVIRGLAWSGSAPVTRVEVSLGSGRWTEAAMRGSHRHAWKQWEMTAQVERPGRLTIRSRATDASRQTQPEHAPWNRLGYGNNSIQTVAVRVV